MKTKSLPGVSFPASGTPWILWRYIFSDYFFSFVITLAFYIVIFLANQILLLAKDVLQINIPLFEVFLLLMYYLPNTISLSIPFAALVSCLMSVGGFSSHNEFVAMRGAGMSFVRTLYPYIWLGVCITGFAFFTNEVLLPWGAINFSKQYQRILTLNPQLSLQENSITKYGGDIIVTKSIQDDGIDGVVIIDTDGEENVRTISAKKARIRSSQNGVVSLELDDVVSIGTENKTSEYNYSIGKKMVYSVLLKNISFDVQSLSAESKNMHDLRSSVSKTYETDVFPSLKTEAENAGLAQYELFGHYEQFATTSLRETLSIRDVNTNVLQKAGDRFLQKRKIPSQEIDYHIEKVVLAKKSAYPSAILLFVLVAFPMGLFYKRSGKTVGFGVGLLLSFLYWILIFIFQSIAITEEQFSPYLLLWAPNAVFATLALALFFLRRNSS